MPFYPQIFQYQQIARPVTFTIPSTIWFQPWSEPVRIKPGLLTGMQEDQGPAGEKPVVSFSWINWLSEPVRQKSGLGAAPQQAFAYGTLLPIIPSFGYFNWLSEPVRQKVGLAAQQQQPFAVDPRPKVSFSYFNWLAEPVRLKPPIAEHKYEFSGYFTPPSGFNVFWFNWLSEPVRQKIGLLASQQQAFAYGTYVPVIPSIDFFNWLSEPVRQKAGIAVQQQQPSVVDPSPKVSFSYFNWLSDPVRQKAGLATQQQQPFAIDPNPKVNFSYYNWLAEPVRLKPIAEHKYEFSAYFTPQVTFNNFWFMPYTEPVRTRTMPTALQPFFSYGSYFPDTPPVSYFLTSVSFTPDRTALGPYEFSGYFTPPTGFNVFWFNWLSEPVRQKVGLLASQQQAFTYGSYVPIIPSIDFFNWLGEPVRQKAGLGAQYQQPFATDPNPRVSFSYFNWLAEPTRLKPIAEHKYEFWSTFTPAPTFTNFWFVPYSEPVRTRNMPTALQPYFSYGSYLPDTPPVSYFLTSVSFSFDRRAVMENSFIYGSYTPIIPSLDYFNWLAEPVRQKLRTAQFQDNAVVFPFTPAVPQIIYNWLSEPVRLPRGLPAYQQKDFNYGTYNPIIPSFGYFNWLGEPVRQRAGLGAPLQQFFAPDPNPRVSFSYFNWLSEPVRQKAGLGAPHQQFFATDPNPRVSFSYFNWLSEPVRQKLGLLTARWQPFTALGTPPIIPSFGYFNALATPNSLYTKRKPLIFTELGWNNFTPAFITSQMRLDATEQGDFFLGVLSTFAVPIRALVDIITFHPVQRYGTGTGIATTSPQRNISAIIPPTPVGQTGMVPQAVRGRVAIIVKPGAI